MGYIIGAVVVIYLAYLLIRYVIIPLVVFLSKIAFWVTLVGAFIVSFVCYVRSFIANINPYDTYVPKNPPFPGAKPSYFFGPGYWQIGQTVKGAWLNNFAVIAMIWGFVGGMDNVILKILLGALGALATAVIAVGGSLWTVALSVAHFSVVFAFMALFYVIFTLVFLIDCAILAVHAISTRCPACKEKSFIPDYICPKCGQHHKKLIPGPYGIFRRKCSCGQPLPCAFFAGRYKLEAHCPKCGVELASGAVRNFGIQLVGGTSSGKTTFLTAFLHLYLQNVGKKPNIALATHPKQYFDELEDWYRQGSSRATPDMNSAMYSIVHTKPGARHGIQLSFYDVAGEIFERQSAEVDQKQFHYCEGIVVVVDPFSDKGVRDKYIAETGKTLSDDPNAQNAFKYSPSHIGDVVTGFIEEFTRIGQLKRGRMSDMPISVVIAKSDVEVVKREVGPQKIKSLAAANSSQYANSEAARDEICKQYLYSIGMHGMISNLEAQFTNIHYFSVSAIGHEADKAISYEPWGIMEAVLWIIREKDKELYDIVQNL